MAKRKTISQVDQKLAAIEEKAKALREEKKKIEAAAREAAAKETLKRQKKIGALIEKAAGGAIDPDRLAAYFHVRPDELAGLRKGE